MSNVEVVSSEVEASHVEEVSHEAGKMLDLDAGLGTQATRWQSEPACSYSQVAALE